MFSCKSTCKGLVNVSTVVPQPASLSTASLSSWSGKLTLYDNHYKTLRNVYFVLIAHDQHKNYW